MFFTSFFEFLRETFCKSVTPKKFFMDSMGQKELHKMYIKKDWKSLRKTSSDAMLDSVMDRFLTEILFYLTNMIDDFVFK